MQEYREFKVGRCGGSKLSFSVHARRWWCTGFDLFYLFILHFFLARAIETQTTQYAINYSASPKYVCSKRGKFFAEVEARGTSQECPECGGFVKKDLSVRVHSCPHCGYTTNRDVAAGQNIRSRGICLISTVGQMGIESACAASLPGTEATESRQVAKSRILSNQET